MLRFRTHFERRFSNDIVSKIKAAAIMAISATIYAVAAPATLAHADQVEIVKYAQSGHWAIYADSAGGCFSITEYSAGTIIKIGFDGRGDNLHPYLIVGGPRISAVGEGQNYRTRAIFDNWNVFQGTSRGGRTTSGRVFLELPLTPDFVAAFAKHNEMTVELAGEIVTKLPLGGTYAAILQTISCQKELSAQVSNSRSQDATSLPKTTTAAPSTLKF